MIAPNTVTGDGPMHCGRRGCSRRYQLYEHLFCMFCVLGFQLASNQIWISGWILPHFDIRTISVASKLKKLQIFLYY